MTYEPTYNDKEMNDLIQKQFNAIPEELPGYAEWVAETVNREGEFVNIEKFIEFYNSLESDYAKKQLLIDLKELVEYYQNRNEPEELTKAAYEQIEQDRKDQEMFDEISTRRK